MTAFNWQTGVGQYQDSESVVPTLHKGQTPAVAGAQVRRLTPTECERLQGFPDGWTIPDPDADPGNPNPKPDGPRYAQMGNAVTVPVIEWLGRRIMEYGT